jgi:hypothetical protein
MRWVRLGRHVMPSLIRLLGFLLDAHAVLRECLL